jgi:hypothetical protein
MVLIRDVVQHALSTGVLSIADENQLRLLLQSRYEPEDRVAFLRLQWATMEGFVRQESREQFQDNSVNSD